MQLSGLAVPKKNSLMIEETIRSAARFDLPMPNLPSHTRQLSVASLPKQVLPGMLPLKRLNERPNRMEQVERALFSPILDAKFVRPSSDLSGFVSQSLSSNF